MQINIGWGACAVEFRKRGHETDEPQLAERIEFQWVERGGYDASPTGISYIAWTSEAGARNMLQQLTAALEEWELWRDEWLRAHAVTSDKHGA